MMAPDKTPSFHLHTVLFPFLREKGRNLDNRRTKLFSPLLPKERKSTRKYREATKVVQLNLVLIVLS